MVSILNMDSFFEGINNLCIILNKFWLRVFTVLKYCLVVMLFLIAILSLLRFRGAYKGTRIYKNKDDEDEKKFRERVLRTHIILAAIYLFLALGIAIGFLTRILILLITPYDSIILMDIINFSGFIPQKYIENVSSYEKAETPMEKLFYYCLAFASFWGFVSILLGMRFMILYANKSHTTSIKLIISGIFICVLTGFTTFMPIFLKV